LRTTQSLLGFAIWFSKTERPVRINLSHLLQLLFHLPPTATAFNFFLAKAFRLRRPVGRLLLLASRLLQSTASCFNNFHQTAYFTVFNPVPLVRGAAPTTCYALFQPPSPARTFRRSD
jgi:hypothetical protein